MNGADATGIGRRPSRRATVSRTGEAGEARSQPRAPAAQSQRSQKNPATFGTQPSQGFDRCGRWVLAPVDRRDVRLCEGVNLLASRGDYPLELASELVRGLRRSWA